MEIFYRCSYGETAKWTSLDSGDAFDPGPYTVFMSVAMVRKITAVLFVKIQILDIFYFFYFFSKLYSGISVLALSQRRNDLVAELSALTTLDQEVGWSWVRILLEAEFCS